MARQGAAPSLTEGDPSDAGLPVLAGAVPPIWGLGDGVDLGGVLGEWLGREADSEALNEIGHAVGVHLQ